MDSRNYPGGDDSVRRLAKDILDLLSPIEPLVMRVQSLLVWEYPRRSAVMVVCVHLLFWFLAATRMSSFFLLSSATLILFFLDTWKKKIWPEIRVPPPVPDDIDGWTPVHPRLLNVHEISQHAAQILYTALNTLHDFRMYRRNNPKFFSSACSTFFVILMLIGHYVPGIMLSYILVIYIMAWPCVMYHNLLQKLYMKMEPALMWLDYNLKTKMTRSVKAAGSHATSPHNASATVEEDDDEFCPPTDPTTTALLARAITDSEDEGGPSCVHTPQLSKEPSIENSENEEEEDFNIDLGLERMPSFDDLDQTDDEFMPNEENTTTSKPMAFLPSHFGDNSDTENDEMTFPDFSEVDHSSSDPSTASNPYSALTSSLVSQTLSSMVENALQGVIGKGDNRSTSSYGRLPGTDAQLTYTRTDEGEAVDLMQEDTTIEEEDEDEEEEDEESHIEADIEKEFDFLDDFDPDSKAKK